MITDNDNNIDDDDEEHLFTKRKEKLYLRAL